MRCCALGSCGCCVVSICRCKLAALSICLTPASLFPCSLPQSKIAAFIRRVPGGTVVLNRVDKVNRGGLSLGPVAWSRDSCLLALTAGGTVVLTHRCIQVSKTQ